VDFDVPPQTPLPSEPIVLFVGSSNALNVKGIHDYLELAWPLVREAVPGARTWIAGPVCDAIEPGLPGVELLGRVDSLDALYGEARVVVNPAIAGTGVKIKTLEALAHGRPPVVWPSGVDGLGPQLAKLCDVAESWFDFAHRVVRQLSRPTDSLLSPDEIRVLLSPEVVYAELRAALAARLAHAGTRIPA
jgi:Glycosyl transferases group 1